MLSSSQQMYVFHENLKIKLIYALFPYLQQQNPSVPSCKCKLHAGPLFLSFCPLGVWENAHSPQEERVRCQEKECLLGQWVIVILGALINHLHLGENSE